MSRIASVILTVFLCTPFCLGQATDRRIDDALAEITLLKRALAEQDRRITELERTVKMLQGAQDQPPRRAMPIPSTAAAWKSPSAWTRVKDGMSRAQVEAILGRPTSVEDIPGGYQTLFYRGEVSGSGSVTGTVKLNDDRVWQVNAPVF